MLHWPGRVRSGQLQPRSEELQQGENSASESEIRKEDSLSSGTGLVEEHTYSLPWLYAKTSSTFCACGSGLHGGFGSCRG